jgi:hypothetical protein
MTRSRGRSRSTRTTAGDGTETRDLASALLDPRSQYVPRGRYFEPLAPFLAVGSGERIAVVAQEELRPDPRATLRTLFAHVDVDVDDGCRSPAVTERRKEALEPQSQLDEGLRHRLTDLLADDADRLRERAGREFPGWSV